MSPLKPKPAKQGDYAFPALRPGLYRLEAEAPGFSKLVRSGIELRVNDRLRVDLQLNIGATTENIVVSAAAPLVESESGALGAESKPERLKISR
jgi:hypothetical protein